MVESCSRASAQDCRFWGEDYIHSAAQANAGIVAFDTFMRGSCLEQWREFARAWNAVIKSLRKRDLLSDESAARFRLHH